MEEKSAAQKETIKKMVNELNKSVPGLALAYDEMGESINMDADILERFVEKAAKQEEYEAQISCLSELYREQAEAAQKTKEMTSCIDEINGKMNELQNEYEKSCAKMQENIVTQLGLFNELDGTAKTSIDNLIGTLKGRVEYMETYVENIPRAMEMGVDEGLVHKLSEARKNPRRFWRLSYRAARKI